MLQCETDSNNSMYYHHPNLQGQTNTTINTQYPTNTQYTSNVPGQSNILYPQNIQGHPNIHYSPIIQPQPNMNVNTYIPNHPNPYTRHYNQDQQLSQIPPRHTTPTATTPMQPLQTDTNNYDLLDYSMSSEEEDMQNRGAPTDKHPWQYVDNKRKRRKRHNEINVTTEETSTSNRYQPLEKSSDNKEDDPEPTVERHQQPQEHKPPPIYIYGVTNFKAMTESLSKIVADEQYYTRTTTENTVKINLKTVEAYRKLVHHLREEGIVFHTYQLKEDRAYRVVIRGLHPTTQAEEIKEELSAKGHQIRNIVNIKHRITKNPLPLFYADLEPHNNNKDIYNIEFLCHTRIIVEPPRKRNDIIQCMRCQRYGHSRTYCTKPYNCVRCGRAHDSRTCKKPRSIPATCALCNGDHPANFKGCSVYQDLRNLKTNNNRNSSLIRQQNQQRQDQHQFGLISTTTTPLNPQQSRKPTYAQIARNNTNTSAENNETEILTTTLTSFLNQFKEMFNQLINQNSMILNMLTTVISKIVH